MTSDHLPPSDDQDPDSTAETPTGSAPAPVGDPAGAWAVPHAPSGATDIPDPTAEGEIVDPAEAPPAATAPTTDAGWGHMWPPPPPGPHAGAWSGHVPGWAPPPASTPPASARKHRGLPVAIAAGLIVAAAAAGVGIGHSVWASPAAKTAAGSTNPGTTSPGQGSGSGLGSPFGNGSTGNGSTGNGSTGNGSTGNGGTGSGENPFGNSDPFGNGGTGNGGTGNGGTGSGATGAGGPSDVSSIAGKIDPALVDINVKFNYQSSGGAGTGIVLTSNGEILTNNHVIDGATSISVTDVGNGKTYDANVVGYDPVHDMAVLQLQGASGLQTASLADSSKLSVGDQVVAVGNAGGQGGTPSAAGGAITALNQSITAADDLTGTNEQLSNLIQTDANVQSGDSGGALVNTNGQVVGMDTASNSNYSLASSTQGFAIPINQAMATVNAIEAGQGSSSIHVGATGFLGVLLGSSDNGNGNFFGGSNGSSGSGAQVSNVVSGGPAAAAGITGGDTITSFDGQTVSSLSTISTAMITHHPGDRVEIGWVDSSGQSHTATVTLASGPPA